MTAAAVMFVSAYVSKHENRVLLVAVYAFVSILFAFGIILGTVTRPDEQTVSFVALLLTVPLLFTDRCEKFLYARKVSVLSQTDLLTGLCNRNSYEQRLIQRKAG